MMKWRPGRRLTGHSRRRLPRLRTTVAPAFGTRGVLGKGTRTVGLGAAVGLAGGSAPTTAAPAGVARRLCTFVIGADPDKTLRFEGRGGSVCLCLTDPQRPRPPQYKIVRLLTISPGIYLQRRSFEVGTPLRNCRFLITRPGMGRRAAGHDTHPRGDRPQPPPPKQTAPHDATARTEALDARPRRHPPPATAGRLPNAAVTTTTTVD